MKPSQLIAFTTVMTTSLAAALPAMADAGDGTWDHHGMMWGGGVGWVMGPIVMLLFLAAAVAVVVLVVRWLGDSSTPGASNQPDRSARRILEERFARGEIDEEEFRQRKRALDE